MYTEVSQAYYNNEKTTTQKKNKGIRNLLIIHSLISKINWISRLHYPENHIKMNREKSQTCINGHERNEEREEEEQIEEIEMKPVRKNKGEQKMRTWSGKSKWGD